MKHEQIKLNIDDFVYRCIECEYIYHISEKNEMNLPELYCPYCHRNNVLEIVSKESIKCY